ncbi:DUF1801 domain-containing protein [Streptomyces sp. NPDC002573]|uniref:DUF1801 domain-containing protein n=1 Tax=Streptomyces sp. NPDC002573 TaxID=3364651 RepID=UPI0036AB8DE9
MQEYVDSIAPGHRSLFDRVSGLILEEFPQASVALSHGMPTYRVEKRRLHIGVWQHGVSIYGWGTDRDGGFNSAIPSSSAERPPFGCGPPTWRPSQTMNCAPSSVPR